MVSYQTSAQNKETIRFGSAKIEVGESEASLSKLRISMRTYPECIMSLTTLR